MIVIVGNPSLCIPIGKDESEALQKRAGKWLRVPIPNIRGRASDERRGRDERLPFGDACLKKYCSLNEPQCAATDFSASVLVHDVVRRRVGKAIGGTAPLARKWGLPGKGCRYPAGPQRLNEGSSHV